MTLGAFPHRHWKPKIACSKCGRFIRSGVVAANAPTPPEAALCGRCYSALMEDPEHFEHGHNTDLGQE